ncbi:hypothetical protein ZEAMMB73_Zm00001d052656 [Zea mays]|uniref:Uncharacterized protein n=2 Tax=Zea mays TaxID=4577 RepID=A0A1D6QI96_MAIZE|nr:hypothetical protein ZEAMMB73_Zm00001d052656 [Zea mays]
MRHIQMCVYSELNMLHRPFQPAGRTQEAQAQEVPRPVPPTPSWMSSANDALACPIRLWHRNPILDSIEGLQCRHRHSWKSSTDGHRAPRWAVLSTAARTACVGSILTPAPTSAPAAQHSDDTSSSL